MTTKRKRRSPREEPVVASADEDHSSKKHTFSHMFHREVSVGDLRRRALTLVDVVADSHTAGPLHWHRIAAALAISWLYWSYVQPMAYIWGVRRWTREVSSGQAVARVGGPGAEVHWAFLVLITILYLLIVNFGIRFMQRRQPVKKRIFEWMVVYNATQALLNLRLAVALVQEVYNLGYTTPWGNEFDPSPTGHKLGTLIWFQYHCRQLDLLDTVFMIMRKKFQRISFVHVYLRLFNLWGWFVACRFACGGDTYFPALVNATCQVFVYLYYTMHLVKPGGIPFFRRARVTELQVLQFVLCSAHAVFVLFRGNVQWYISILNLFIMLFCLVFYIDFEGDGARLAPKKTLHAGKWSLGGDEKVTLCFDSCGWLKAYHFGVAHWVHEHCLPEGLTTDNADTDLYPKGLAMTGSSGGALAACALGSGVVITDLFNWVMHWRATTSSNPMNIYPALHSCLDNYLTKNAPKSMSGRVRTLLTRVSLKPPFVTGEMVDQYSSWRELYDTLCATCHIPLLHLLPKQVSGRFYFDGAMWGVFFVPWASDESHLIRVSALSRPSADVAAPFQPLWWALIPPHHLVLRGLFWVGYRDAARYFSAPPADAMELCKCRRASKGRSDSDWSADGMSAPTTPSSEARANDRDATFRAARKLIIRDPDDGQELPKVCPMTGCEVAELIDIYNRCVEKNMRYMSYLLYTVIVSLLAMVVFS